MHLKILDNLKNNFNWFGDKIMYKELDIIEILRDEERLGKLHSKSNSNYIDENIKEKSYENTNNKDTSNKNIDATNLNELYKTVFENSAVAITITDEKERIISWNKYTETLLGMNKDDLLLKMFLSFIHQKNGKKFVWKM